MSQVKFVQKKKCRIRHPLMISNSGETVCWSFHVLLFPVLFYEIQFVYKNLAVHDEIIKSNLSIYSYYAEACNEFVKLISASLRPDNRAPFEEMLQP